MNTGLFGMNKFTEVEYDENYKIPMRDSQEENFTS